MFPQQSCRTENKAFGPHHACRESTTGEVREFQLQARTKKPPRMRRRGGPVFAEGSSTNLAARRPQMVSYAKRPPSLAAVFPATAMSRRKDHRERGEANVLGRPGSDLLFQVLRLSTIGAGEFYGRVRDGIGYRPPAKTTRPAKDE